jgi:hypothetical protein
VLVLSLPFRAPLFFRRHIAHRITCTDAPNLTSM